MKMISEKKLGMAEPGFSVEGIEPEPKLLDFDFNVDFDGEQSVFSLKL